jgi:hypothetical protein
MKQIPVLVKWLALAAAADWLLNRTLTRLAIYMPKSAPVILVYQGLEWLGQLAGVFSGLLGLGILAWIAGSDFRRRRAPLIWVSCAALFGFAWISLFVALPGWLALAYHLCLLALLAALLQRAWRAGQGLTGKLAGLLVGAALAISQVYQALPRLYVVSHSQSSTAWSLVLYHAGELLVLASVALLWLAHGRAASRIIWLAGALPGLAFSAMRLADPALAGILAIWSTGLSLFLPWPMYPLALWLATVTVLQAGRNGSPAGWALLLLAAGGYLPQTNVQVFFGIVALWLLAPGAPDPVEASETAAQLARRAA